MSVAIAVLYAVNAALFGSIGAYFLYRAMRNHFRHAKVRVGALIFSSLCLALTGIWIYRLEARITAIVREIPTGIDSPFFLLLMAWVTASGVALFVWFRKFDT